MVGHSEHNFMATRCRVGPTSLVFLPIIRQLFPRLRFFSTSPASGHSSAQHQLSPNSRLLTAPALGGPRWNARAGGSVREGGWHFSCERGCTRDDCGKAGPFSVERLKKGPAFCGCFVCTSKYTAKCRPSCSAYFLSPGARTQWITTRLTCIGLPSQSIPPPPPPSPPPGGSISDGLSPLESLHWNLFTGISSLGAVFEL